MAHTADAAMSSSATKAHQGPVTCILVAAQEEGLLIV